MSAAYTVLVAERIRKQDEARRAEKAADRLAVASLTAEVHLLRGEVALLREAIRERHQSG